MSNNPYVIRKAEEKEKDSIVELLMAYYIPEETLVQSYIIGHQHKFQEDVTQTAEASLKKSLEELLMNYPCVMVTVHEPSNKIVGVLGIEKPMNNSTKAEIDKERSLKVKWSYALQDVMHHLWSVSRTANYYKRSQTHNKKEVLFNLLTVHKEHRGHELSTAMLRKGIEWAKENSYDLPQGVFTSVYAKKSALRAGMKQIYERDLRTIKNMEGSPVFEDMTPNNDIAVMEFDLAGEATTSAAK